MLHLNFSIDDEIDLVALYAALLSTVLAIWEYIKWRSKNAIELTCTPNMIFVPSVDNNTYVAAKVINKGETQTTITHFIGYHWNNYYDKIFNSKKKKAFIVNTDQVPKVVQPGEVWMGQALQTPDIEKMASDGLLYMGVFHSMGKKEIMQRIKISKSTQELEKAHTESGSRPSPG